MREDDSNIVHKGERVYVYDGNTEIHSVWYGVYLKTGELVNGFSGDTPEECERAKREAIACAERIDRGLE